MPDITIKVHADLPKEYMYNVGIKSELPEKAANYFKYFNAVELDLIVDSETGEVKQVKTTIKGFK